MSPQLGWHAARAAGLVAWSLRKDVEHHGPPHGLDAIGVGPDRDATRPYADATVVDVTATDLAFDPTAITIDAGQATNLRLTNEGQVSHDLTIPDLDVTLAAEPGETVTAGITVDTPGTYEFVCTVPGHADAGMRGTLTVT